MPGLFRYIRRLSVRRDADESRLPDFELAGRRFSDVRLTWRTTSAKTVSRAGRLSWRAHMDGEPVRIIQCDNEPHARFIASMVARPELCGFFPECPLQSDRYIVFRWIEGEQFAWSQVRGRPELLREVAQIQAALHRFTPQLDPSQVGYGYLEFLNARLDRYRGLFPLTQAMRRIVDNVRSLRPGSEARLAHPDVTGRNMVIERGSGRLKLVDNESLHQNNYYLIDLCNTHKSFGQRLGTDLLRPYLNHYVACGGSLRPMIDHELFFNSLWHLRLIGYYLQDGKAARAMEVAERFGDGTNLNALQQTIRSEFASR